MDWSKKWQLPFNETKCKVIHVGKSNVKKTYTMNLQALETSDADKDLGVIVDNSLKFHVHVASAVKKANQVLGTIKRTYKTRDPDTIKLLYTAMIRPLLEYGNIIWGPHYIEDKRSVEKIQRRATKIINGMQNFSYEERLSIKSTVVGI